MNKIIPMYADIEENKYTFVFYTDRPLTHDEKMEIASKGLKALKEVVKDEVGALANHNMCFGFEN